MLEPGNLAIPVRRHSDFMRQAAAYRAVGKSVYEAGRTVLDGYVGSIQGCVIVLAKPGLRSLSTSGHHVEALLVLTSGSELLWIWENALEPA